MIISIVLNTEYWDVALRIKWYLKNLLHCKENNWILITHEYLGKHFEKIEEEVTDRLFKEFEMRKFSVDEVLEVEQYFLPDSLFDSFENECGSRTQALISLVDKGNEKIESALRDIINEALTKHPGEKIDAIFHCLECFEFMRNISKEYNAPLINYSFSAIRKPHGYMQTLYHTSFTSGSIYTSKECKERYNKFLREDAGDLPVLSNREIIALLGKERTLPLIPLIDYKPKYEMGICGESFAILPQFFNRYVYTDDDIFYECNKLFSHDTIVLRHHAAQLDMMRVDRTVYHNDPAAFILSCKRLAGVRSQIMLKVLLWKRPAIMKKETTCFSFMCSKDYMSNEVADLKALNYYMFGFLIPSGLMFSDDYWKWRLTNPTEVEIYRKHLLFILKELNIPNAILGITDEKERYIKLLKSRRVDEQLLDILSNNRQPIHVNYDTATSRFTVQNKDTKKDYWRLNEYKSERIFSSLRIVNDNISSISFYPLDDIAGSCELESVVLNGSDVSLDSIIGYKQGFKYMQKVSGCYVIPIKENSVYIEITCIWKHKTTKDFLNSLE